MASAQKTDWSSDERKLQSAYEDVQSGKYKLASAEVTRFLKKFPRSQPALLLRAYLLTKLGGTEAEVLQTWQSVERTGELSPRGMWWADILMRSVGRLDILLATYTKTWASKPDSTEIGEQVVLVSTACWDTTIMCTSSRKMFNMTKTATWARVAAWAEWADKSSHQLVPEHGFPPPLDSNSLRISATLLSTTRKDIPSSQFLWLHVQIFLSSGQEEEALQLVRKEGKGGGGIARNWWRLRTVQEVLRRMKERGDKEGVERVVKEEMDDFGELLKRSEDMQRNWANYEHILSLVTSSPSLVSTAKDLFTSLYGSIGSRERAPALALLHLDARMRSLVLEGVKTMEDEDYKSAVETYWRQWGSKGVVVDDLAGQWAGREVLLASTVQAWTEEGHNDVNSYLAGKHARLLLFRLKATGWEPTEDEFKDTWAYYLSGVQYGANLPNTDTSPADEIGLAAVQILCHLWADKGDERYLLRAIICLRKICDDSPSCAQARYLLIRLYRLAGAPILIVGQLEQLRLVEIQLDTLLHIVTEKASVDCLIGQISAVLAVYKERAEYMYRKISSDLQEQIKRALENESYSQIHSIRHLRSTLARSLPAGILATEFQKISLLQRQPKTALTAELAKARDADQQEDTRSWELLPHYVGTKGMDQVLSLGGGTDAGSIKVWRDVLRAVDTGSAIEILQDLRMPSSESDTLNAMARVINAAHTVLNTQTERSQHSSEQVKPTDDLKDLGEACIRNATSNSGSRFDKYHTASLLIQVFRITEILISRLETQNKPKGAKRNSPASQVIVTCTENMKYARAQLRKGLKEVVDSLEQLKKVDHDWDWEEVGAGVMDTAYCTEIGEEILDARGSALRNLRFMLEK